MTYITMVRPKLSAFAASRGVKRHLHGSTSQHSIACGALLPLVPTLPCTKCHIFTMKPHPWTTRTPRAHKAVPRHLYDVQGISTIQTDGRVTIFAIADPLMPKYSFWPELLET